MTTDSTKAMTPMQALAQIADGTGLSKHDMQDLAALAYNTAQRDAHLAPREVTTEHVSVPRKELLRVAVELEENALGQVGSSSRESMASAKAIRAILSRATPSDVSSREDDMYEHGMSIFSNTPPPEKPSAPRVVTAELSNTLAGDIAEHLRDKGWSSGGDYQDDFLPDVEIATRAALDSFANSMSAARVPDGFIELLARAEDVANVDWTHMESGSWQKMRGLRTAIGMAKMSMLAAAPQAGERG